MNIDSNKTIERLLKLLSSKDGPLKQEDGLTFIKYDSIRLRLPHIGRTIRVDYRLDDEVVASSEYDVFTERGCEITLTGMRGLIQFDIYAT